MTSRRGPPAWFVRMPAAGMFADGYGQHLFSGDCLAFKINV